MASRNLKNIKDSETMLSFLILALGIFASTVVIPRVVTNINHGQQSHSQQKPTQVYASSQKVIGTHNSFLGSPNAPYTLVEFGDYECPPCMQSYSDISDLVDRSNGKIRFTFRHSPLSMHASARQKAIAAEVARENGMFNKVHENIFTSDTFPDDLKTVYSMVGKDMEDVKKVAIARKAVDTDVQDASALGVNSTPTFFLCTPEGKVYKLLYLEQYKTILK